MHGESGIRIKAIATELYNLYVEGEYLLKQAGWTSATGEYLDRIAAECGIERKTASKASGEITFLIDEAKADDTVIPSGIICEKSVTVKAQALADGEEYNAAYGEVCVMVNPPSSVAKAENRVSFIGGCNSEDDEALRLRIKDALRYPANGVNVEFLKGRIMSFDEVADCDIIREGDKPVCILKTRNKILSENLKEKVNDVLSLFTLIGIDFDVRNADENGI